MYDAEVIVIGSGAAGLMAALTAAPHREVLLVTDRALGRSNTAMAQGGLQLPRQTPEARAAFVSDMLRSARVPVSVPRVHRFAEQVSETVSLLQQWGMVLNRGDDGTLIRRIAGGMSAPRVVNTPKRIGPSLIKLLRSQLAASGATAMPRTPVQRIIPDDRGGLLVETAPEGSAPRRLRAKRVICCSGGIGWWEARRLGHLSSNPPNENHRLYQSLLRLGLPRAEPDAFQYHPYGMISSVRDGVGVCVPESISGFPVRLLDRAGQEICPIRQDRYTLTQAMFAAAAAGRAIRGDGGLPGFRLTLSELDPEVLRAVFPKVHKRLAQTARLGADVLVFPFLHYQLGGFRVDVACRTPLPGLLLAGEMVGGIHGLNRLMGNGLTDSLVHGRLAGLSVSNLEK